jgi:hypothetical protein
MPLRAKTYLSIATGDCPSCGGSKLDLRFCYNPYGDDVIICMECANKADELLEDDSKTS